MAVTLLSFHVFAALQDSDFSLSNTKNLYTVVVRAGISDELHLLKSTHRALLLWVPLHSFPFPGFEIGPMKSFFVDIWSLPAFSSMAHGIISN